MRYVRPSYYDAFRCAADACPSTCCEGWQIVIDAQSLKRYRDYTGDFGQADAGLRLLGGGRVPAAGRPVRHAG